MLTALRRPLPMPVLLTAAAGAVVLVALYCVAYTRLAGQPESLAQASAWAIANVLPWLLAIEAGKRAATWTGAAAVLALAAALSIALGYLLGSSDDPVAFELVRRLPPLLAAMALVTLLRSPVGRRHGAAEGLPLLPRQIDWVRAAGNYVEIRAGERTVIHRCSMSAAEQQLSAHGFVRIHRSLLVRRDRIARVRPQDVVLHDGTHLKIGKRYRAALAP
jgi:hypothetical protein